MNLRSRATTLIVGIIVLVAAVAFVLARYAYYGEANPPGQSAPVADQKPK